MEHRYRSFLKAISWRITGSIDTFIISYLLTGKATVAISISGVEVFTKTILYYFHERVWDKMKVGRKEYKPEYEI